jgi:hypothetical protein
MADGIFMDRISGGLANRKRRAALQRRLIRNYRIVTDQRKGQSVFGASREHGARQPALPIRHNFITIARTKTTGL